MKRNLLLGIAAAAAASSTFAFVTAPAQAACQPNSNECSTFDPGAAAVPTLGVANPFQFAGSITPTANLTQMRIGFRLPTADQGYTGTFPVTFGANTFSFSGPGGAFAPGNSISTADAVSVLSISNGIAWTGFKQFAIPFGAATATSLASVQLSFDIPAGLNLGTKINAIVQYSNGTANSDAGDDVLNSSFFVSTASTASTPSPLPVLGASAAFAFSRRLRSRIRLAG